MDDEAPTAAAVTAGDGRLRPAVAWPPVLAVAGALLAVLLALADRYGPHRDELYFVSAGRRPDWGYPDQPPLTPLLARAADLVAPGSLVALHAVAALAVAGTVVLAALIARELGGSTAAQVLTAVTVATGVATVLLGHMLVTATLDVLLWTAVLLAVVRVLQCDAPRGWLVVGLLGGVALQNKHLAAFLLGAVVVGVALVPATRHHLRSRWAWAGAGVAVALWLPNLVWQTAHGWPQLTLAAQIREEFGTVEERLAFVALLLVILSPVAAVLMGYGWVRLLRDEALVRVRPLAWASALLTVVFLVTGGKAYYLVGVMPVLVAAGACGLAARRDRRGLVAAGAVLAVSGVVGWPLALPLLPQEVYADSFVTEIDDSQAEMIGWPAFVGTVRDVVEDSGATVVVTANYGEAAALEWWDVGVPVHSGHNGFALWGPPAEDDGPVVVVGYRAPPWAEGCTLAATISTGADNEEDGAPVAVCTGPRGSWAEVWDEVVHLDA